MTPTEYTHCQDYEPHQAHTIEIRADETHVYCIGSD